MRTIGGLIFAALAPAAVARAQTAALNPLHDLNKEELKGFRERPLFTPSRAAPAIAPPRAKPPAGEAPTTPAPPPTVRLVGIVTGAPDLAIVRIADANATTFLTTGDTIGGWHVTVFPAGIRLEADERRIEIALFAPKSASQDPPGQTAPSGAPPMQEPPPPP